MEYSSTQFKKVFISTGIRLVIILSIAGGLIVFFANEITKESKSLYNEKTLTTIIDKRNDNLDKLKTDIAAVKKDIVNMEAVVPSESRIFEIVRLFESLAKNFGGNAAINFGDPQIKDGTFIETPLHFIISGNADFFEKYLKLLESTPYGIKFLSAGISGPTGIVNNGEMRV